MEFAYVICRSGQLTNWLHVWDTHEKFMLYLRFVYIIVYELYLVKVQLGRKMNLASIQYI